MPRTETRSVAAPIAMMLAGCALVAGTTLFGKILGSTASANPLHPLQISAGRFTFAFLTLLPFLLYHRPSLKGAKWTNHIVRVLLGWAGVSCMFAAASVMRLADATAISFLNPIISMMLSIPLLNERVGPWRWAAAGTAFIGAIILTQPGTDAFQPIAAVAFLSAVFVGAEMILIKRLADSEPPLRILGINNFLGTVIALFAASFAWKMPTLEQWPMLAAIGILMVSAQSLFLQAMRRGDASFVVPFFYSTLIFAGIYDYVTFDVTPTTAGLIGAALIVIGAFVIAWREQIQRKRAAQK